MMLRTELRDKATRARSDALAAIAGIRESYASANAHMQTLQAAINVMKQVQAEERTTEEFVDSIELEEWEQILAPSVTAVSTYRSTIDSTIEIAARVRAAGEVAPRG